MVKITKDEAQYLRSKNLAHYVHMSSKTHQDRKKYYATECWQVFKVLNPYRQKQILWSSERGGKRR